MTGNKISALGIELLDTEKCELESKTVEYSEKPFEPSTYCYEHLSNTQKKVFDAINNIYQNFLQGSKSNCVFLDGQAGLGKHSFIYNALQLVFREPDKI